jgi:hypothetical protein
MSSVWNLYSKLASARWIWAAVAAAFSALCFAFEARIGFNLSDEGFLWYGARQVVSGAVPVRDFQGYDIARYYVTAGVMAMLRDDGILALRTCLGVVQAVGVALAVYLVHINVPRLRLLYVVLTAAVFVCWIMVHPYKNFDVVACIGMLAGLAFALSQPSAFRWFVAGASIGIAAVLGCNHGVYGAAAGAGAVVYACWGLGRRKHWQAAAWLCIGVVIGYLPNVIMIAAIPGLARAYWAGIIGVFQSGTNLPLPIPWPWLAFTGSAWTADAWRGFVVGMFFLALPTFAAAGLISAFHLRSRVPRRQLATFVAAALLALPYAHYAYSRADIPHLSFGIFPLLIGLLVWPLASSYGRFVTAGLLLAASVLVTGTFHPAYDAQRMADWRELSIDGDMLKIAPADADTIELLGRLAERYACNGRSFFVTPYWPGAYAVLHRKAPVWEIYALFSKSSEFQQMEIERIKAADPGFAVIINRALDGKDQWRYVNTHPLIERFVRETFIPVQGAAEIYAQPGAEDKCK